MHFQNEPFSQAKLITCIQGRILDVVLDLSSNPKEPIIHLFELSAESGEILFVPRGFAHGFQALANETEIIYAVDRSYQPDSEVVIDIMDEELGIEWKHSPLLSEKDKLGTSFTHWIEINREAK